MPYNRIYIFQHNSTTYHTIWCQTIQWQIKPYQTKSSLTKSYYSTQYNIIMLPAFCHIVPPAFCHIITPAFCHIIESTFFNIVALPYHMMPNHTMTYKPYQTKSIPTISYYTTNYDIIMLPAFCHILAPAFCHIITPAFLPYNRIYIFQHSSTNIPYDAKPYNNIWNLTKPNQALLNHTILHNMIS